MSVYFKCPVSGIFMLLLLSFTGMLQAQILNVTSSDIRWKAYKTLGPKSASHYGRVKLLSGSVILKGGSPAGGSFTVDMKSLTAEDLSENSKYRKMLENHLKSDDFFDVSQYPTANFKLTGLRRSGTSDLYSVTGILTIKKSSKKIVFPANLKMQNGELQFASKLKFNRKDFGLKYNIFEDMLISNDVELDVSFTAR